MNEILISLCGLNPQVITETLYFLTQEKKPPAKISEIYVITTQDGLDKIRDSLLHPKRGKFYAFCREYGIPPSSIKFCEETIVVIRDSSGTVEQGKPIKDIRTAADNEAMARQIINFIREKTSEPNTAHYCSLAGGRKTMSFYLGCALQLFGRPQDTLSHVLVSEDFETHKDFFYKPKRNQTLLVCDQNGNVIKRLQTKDAKIELAEVPYVRLRDKIEAWFGTGDVNYSELINLTQKELDQLPPIYPLQICINDRKVFIGGKEVKLQPLQIAIYAHYVRNKLTRCRGKKSENCHGCDTCFETMSKAMRNSAPEILSDYERMYDEFSRYLTQRKKRWREGIRRKELEQNICKINREIKKLIPDPKIHEYYIISSLRSYGNTRYGIKLARSKIKIF